MKTFTMFTIALLFSSAFASVTPMTSMEPETDPIVDIPVTVGKPMLYLYEAGEDITSAPIPLPKDGEYSVCLDNYSKGISVRCEPELNPMPKRVYLKVDDVRVNTEYYYPYYLLGNYKNNIKGWFPEGDEAKVSCRVNGYEESYVKLYFKCEN